MAVKIVAQWGEHPLFSYSLIEMPARDGNWYQLLGPDAGPMGEGWTPDEAVEDAWFRFKKYPEWFKREFPFPKGLLRRLRKRHRRLNV